MSATIYTLDRIREVSEKLQRDADESIAEIRRMAAEGDRWAIAVIAEWEALGDSG